MKKYFCSLLFLFILVSNGLSQTMAVSEPLPESGRYILGIWKNKVVSTLGRNEVFIVDNRLAYSREQVLLKPRLEHAAESWLLKVWMHGKFLYEVHYIFEERKVEPAKAKRNILVKRDVETLEIVSQRELPHNLLNLKFCLSDEEGFFLCLGTTHPTVNPEGVYLPKLSNRKVIPRMLYRFDYELEQKWSYDFPEYDPKTTRMINDWAVDDDGNIQIPVFRKDPDQLGRQSLFSVIELVVIDPEGTVTVKELDVPEWDFELASAHVLYDKTDHSITGRFIITRRFGQEVPFKKQSGFQFVKWDPNGRIIHRNQEWLRYKELLSDENREYLNKLKLDTEADEVPLELLPESDSYHLMPNGDVFFFSDRVEDENDLLMNSKLFFMISKEGALIWKKLLVYDNHRLYNYDSWKIEGSTLYLYIREYRTNCQAGIYYFQSSFVNTDGRNVDLYLRTIDLTDGRQKSMLPVYPDNPDRKYEAEPFVYVDPVKNTHQVRYKNPKLNLEKVVTISF